MFNKIGPINSLSAAGGVGSMLNWIAALFAFFWAWCNLLFSVQFSAIACAMMSLIFCWKSANCWSFKGKMSLIKVENSMSVEAEEQNKTFKFSVKYRAQDSSLQRARIWACIRTYSVSSRLRNWWRQWRWNIGRSRSNHCRSREQWYRARFSKIAKKSKWNRSSWSSWKWQENFGRGCKSCTWEQSGRRSRWGNIR